MMWTYKSKDSCVHTGGVTGSIPVPPTIQTNPRAPFIKRRQLAAAKSATLNSATIYIRAID